ncbi:ABC transporter substrate-binding protein, partial [Pantoea sp. SIMBA_133]
VVDVHADGADSVIIELNTPNIDFPLLIGAYHFSIIKDGTEDFTVPNGTGPFRVKEFRPGMRTSGVRFEDYWRNGLPYLDEFEIFSILDNE